MGQCSGASKLSLVVVGAIGRVSWLLVSGGFRSCQYIWDSLVFVGVTRRIWWLLVQMGGLSGVVQPGGFGGCQYIRDSWYNWEGLMVVVEVRGFGLLVQPPGGRFNGCGTTGRVWCQPAQPKELKEVASEDQRAVVVKKGTGWWHRGVETSMGAVETSMGAPSLRNADVGVPWG